MWEFNRFWQAHPISARRDCELVQLKFLLLMNSQAPQVRKREFCAIHNKRIPLSACEIAPQSPEKQTQHTLRWQKLSSQCHLLHDFFPCNAHSRSVIFNCGRFGFEPAQENVAKYEDRCHTPGSVEDLQVLKNTEWWSWVLTNIQQDTGQPIPQPMLICLKCQLCHRYIQFCCNGKLL